MTESGEQKWLQGNRAAWKRIFDMAASELHKDGELDAAALSSERMEAIIALRDICEQHGDNDWPDNLHLADIIEKHLHRHLGE
jgi:hypothetical protein